jgi:hypothetical protein
MRSNVKRWEIDSCRVLGWVERVKADQCGSKPRTFANSVIVSLEVWSWSCSLDNLERSLICFPSALAARTTLVGQGRQVYIQG